MNNFYSKLIIIKDSLIGYIKKCMIDCKGNKISFPGNKPIIPVVVSLTSYGRRVSSVVYYTLISILNQTVRPKRIILWLDESWTKDTLPTKLIFLEKFGVEYRFCKDIKSYKKLIPTLEAYPDDIIVTVDDDIYYNRKLLQTLWEGYQKDGNIQCIVAKIPICKGTNEFDNYKKWLEIRTDNFGQFIMPIGAGGILYPPQSLSCEVRNEKDFMQFAPCADDLWFWVMAKRANSHHSLSELKGNNYSFDAVYQYLHKGSALMHSNAGESMNEIQLKNIINKYPLDATQ